MKKISFKNWILAGALSGVVIGILLSVLFLIPLIISLIVVGEFPSEGAYFLPTRLVHFIFIIYSYVFLGLIIGIILFLIRNRLVERLSKYIIISIGLSVLFTFVSFFALVAPELLRMKGVNERILELIEPFLYFCLPTMGTYLVHVFIFTFSHVGGILFFFILEGVAFGFLINYFISRMERKTSK